MPWDMFRSDLRNVVKISSQNANIKWHEIIQKVTKMRGEIQIYCQPTACKMSHKKLIYIFVIYGRHYLNTPQFNNFQQFQIIQENIDIRKNKNGRRNFNFILIMSYFILENVCLWQISGLWPWTRT